MLQLKETEKKKMTYILDVKNPLGKITVSDYLKIWGSIVKIKLNIYTCDSSVSPVLFCF